jgi:hypothetical protein
MKQATTQMSAAIKYPVIGAQYNHYKGGQYQVLSMAEHTETKEKLVIYKSIQFGSLHARPLDSWNGRVKVGKTMVPRFTIVTKSNTFMDIVMATCFILAPNAKFWNDK